MALKVEVHSFTIIFCTQQRVLHAHHLRPLLIDGDGVEVANLDIVVRLHWMGHRPRILRELHRAQHPHILNSLDCSRVVVSGKFLVPKNSQSLFQAELEPVPTGDAVTGPVVKIFMGHDSLDIEVVEIGRRIRSGQHEFRVKDIEALVLHRPHIEVVDRHNIEEVEIVLPPINLLIPHHRALQRGHCVITLIDIVGFGIDSKRHLTPGGCLELILNPFKVTGHQREEVGRFGKWILPGDPVATIRVATTRGAIAV